MRTIFIFICSMSILDEAISLFGKAFGVS